MPKKGCWDWNLTWSWCCSYHKSYVRETSSHRCRNLTIPGFWRLFRVAERHLPRSHMSSGTNSTQFFYNQLNSNGDNDGVGRWKGLLNLCMKTEFRQCFFLDAVATVMNVPAGRSSASALPSEYLFYPLTEKWALSPYYLLVRELKTLTFCWNKETTINQNEHLLDNYHVCGSLTKSVSNTKKYSLPFIHAWLCRKHCRALAILP